MRYSLVNKFQGAYLGGFLGKQTSSNCKSLELNGNINLIVQDIINESEADFVIWKKYFADLTNLTDIILSLLPWVLFYHDNWYQLHSLIAQISSKQSHLKCQDIELAEVWIYEVVLILKEKLEIRNPIKQIINSRKIQYSLNLEQLKLIDISLSQGQSSRKLLENLLTKTSDSSRIELLFSLYLFWSISEDFCLIIKRGIAVASKFNNTVSLTGILAGAYNSVSGIQLHKFNLTKNNPSLIEDLAIVKKLFIFWSGIYHYDIENARLSVIATPQTLQTRSNLKIISQEEYQ